LRQALDHARDSPLSETNCAILFSYCDALARHHQIVGSTLHEILDAVERGSFEDGITMILEMAISQGADRHLLLNALAQLCADSRMRAFGATPSSDAIQLSNVQLQVAASRAMTKFTGKDDKDVGLTAALLTKATQHAKLELSKAWDELDSAYAGPGGDSVGGAKKDTGPGSSPFSNEEEHFFIRNQLVNAINLESLSEVRRALTYALAFGIDPKTVEMEVAYCDALVKQQQPEGFNPDRVKEVLENGDWWSALDIVVGVALARGVDRTMLQKMIGKVCSTSQFALSVTQGTEASGTQI